MSKTEKKIVKKNPKEQIKKEVDTSTTNTETEQEKGMDDIINDREDEKCIICLDKVYRVLGYKEKRLAIKLLNGKYNFMENVDYKVVDGSTMITPECYRLLCLLSRTEQGDKYRRFIIDKMFQFVRDQKLEINYEIAPIPCVHFENLDIFDNRRVFYVINIKDEQYIYGITTDISMLISILKDTYNVIINKIWLLEDNINQEKLLSECKTLLNEEKYPKVDKLKSCFRASNIYELLMELNNIIFKFNMNNMNNIINKKIE
jgi:hypothetical protein